MTQKALVGILIILLFMKISKLISYTEYDVNVQYKIVILKIRV